MAAQSRVRTQAELDQMFFARIRLEDGSLATPCWIWTGTFRRDGYGVRGIRGKCVPCHRWAYKRWIGEVPHGLFCCHHCDNRKCCNPHHLFLGDWTANAQDALRKGRLMTGERWRKTMDGKTPKGENHCCAKLTEAQVRYIRASMAIKTQMQVVREMGLSRNLVRGVWEGKTWKHVR